MGGKLVDFVLQAHNFARTDPAGCAARLRAWLADGFEKDGFTRVLALKGGTKLRIRTKEGVAAVKEAVEFLEKQSPLAPLESISEGLCKAGLWSFLMFSRV
jgi:hypothetical protein